MKAQSKEHIEKLVFYPRSGLILSMDKEKIFVPTDIRHTTWGSQVPTQAAWQVPWEGTSAAEWRLHLSSGSGRKPRATRLDGGNTLTYTQTTGNIPTLQHEKWVCW